ncbi:ATP-dependent DNA helicase [Trichonephila clavata]|uniref:ATP-dependent DNA helicase n=1 Tax=Trichonephila clavata TaxID=2740835 RepID=A0A8X6K9L5_TRICU|nr:ATP-dependent DNA helicase [Trichonephila clavata]
MAVIGIGAENSKDEVTQYQMGRYVSSNEAVWRIFSFPIHERHPSVVHLAVHLENGQRVYFTAQNAVQRAAQPPSTTLTSFFETCQNDDFAQTLLYSEMPKYYTWNQSSRRFIRRKQGKPVPGYTDVYSTDAIGRIYSVHPSNDECFYLRLLLVNVRGPTSFQQLRTVDGKLCGSYREACQRLQLLENDAHWDQTLNDAVISSHAHQIRTLFSIIISTCFPSNPIYLWIKYKDYMCDDILYQIRNRMGNPNIQISEEIYNEALISIEDMCLIMSNKLLIQLGLTAPNRPMHDAFNQELHRERLYDLNTLKELIQTNLPLLNEQQKYVFETLMKFTTFKAGAMSNSSASMEFPVFKGHLLFWLKFMQKGRKRYNNPSVITTDCRIMWSDYMELKTVSKARYDEKLTCNGNKFPYPFVQRANKTCERSAVTLTE